MAVLGLHFCARAFPSCGKWGPLFIAVHGPLPIAEHRLQTRRLSSRGSRAQLLRGMWDPPRPGLEPVCPALAGRFSTTAPPGKSHDIFKQRTATHHGRYPNEDWYKRQRGTSLVVQWIRTCLPMQGTQARSLVQEDPTCHGATKPICHNY